MQPNNLLSTICYPKDIICCASNDSLKGFSCKITHVKSIHSTTSPIIKTLMPSMKPPGGRTSSIHCHYYPYIVYRLMATPVHCRSFLKINMIIRSRAMVWHINGRITATYTEYLSISIHLVYFFVHR